jgi:hypothetical protein
MSNYLIAKSEVVVIDENFGKFSKNTYFAIY